MFNLKIDHFRYKNFYLKQKQSANILFAQHYLLNVILKQSQHEMVTPNGERPTLRPPLCTGLDRGRPGCSVPSVS